MKNQVQRGLLGIGVGGNEQSKLREMQSGQVLEARMDDPSARGDVEAWSRLSGNALLRAIDHEGQVLRFFVQINKFLS